MKQVLKYFKSYPSISVIILVCLTVIEINFNLVRWKTADVLYWDVSGYYSYLPATFIQKDLKLTFVNDKSKVAFKGDKYIFNDDRNGNHIIKYTMGLSVLYAPFFAIAHVFAQALGYKADGFSEIYHFCIGFSGLFYLLFGLWFLRKTLLFFYSEKVTAITLFLIFFASNLLYYSSVESAMSHVYTFFVFSIFIYFVILYFENPLKKYVFFLALFYGLIVLIRPLNALLIIVLLLYDVKNITDFKTRFLFFKKSYKHVILFFVITLIVLLPQLLYWNYVTGHFFVFSYGNEKFYFSNPHIIQCLIGFRKGWLIYTPVMLFAIFGIWLMKKQFSNSFYLVTITVIIIYLYLISSWWCWWYGGSFGLRSMIDIYPLLSIAIAAFISKLYLIGKTKKIIICFILVFLVSLNLMQTYQYKRHVIHYDAMTFNSYINGFDKLQSQYIDTTLLNHPNYDRAIMGFDN